MDGGAFSDSYGLPEPDLENEEPQGPPKKKPIRFGWIVGVKVKFSNFCIFFILFNCV